MCRDGRGDVMGTFRDVLDMFGENGERWIQKKYYGVRYIGGENVDTFCLTGAIVTDNSKQLLAKVAILRDVIAEQYPGYGNLFLRDQQLVETWNDAPMRVFDEVRAICEKAAVKEEEYGAEN
jgi:hypothetical protein